VRIRIALSTATAVSMTTAAFFTLLNSSPAASAKSNPAEHTATASFTTPALASFAVPMTVNTATGPTVEVAGNPIVVPSSNATSPLPVPIPPVAQTDGNSPYTNDWMCIRIHESGNQYNNPNEPSGAYGILVSTWHDFGYSGWPYQASAVVQDHLALELYSLYGFHPWSSRFACGL
jgi:hypothetical protein